MEDEIARKVEELRSKLPKQHPPTPKAMLQFAELSYGDPIAPEEYERYNQGVDAYVAEYEQYLRETKELQTATGRSIRF